MFPRLSLSPNIIALELQDYLEMLDMGGYFLDLELKLSTFARKLLVLLIDGGAWRW